MHTFDLKTLLFARHAQHVVLVHFPSALLIVGVIFDLLSQWKKRPLWSAVAYCNLSIAAIATIPTVITGLLGWQWALEGQHLRGVLRMHLILGCASSLLIWVVWLIHFDAKSKEAPLPRYRLPIEIAAVIVIAATAHLGGFLKRGQRTSIEILEQPLPRCHNSFDLPPLFLLGSGGGLSLRH